MNNSPSPRYIPALKYHALTRFYDSVVRLTTREQTFKAALVRQCHPQAGEHLLDVGCGTGTLTHMLASKQPNLRITGLDADPNTLKQARAKLAAMKNSVTLQQGFAQQLPFDSATFDLAVSSLFFHHLTKTQKLETLKEIRRVLKPGGRLHIADWGKPSSFFQRILFFIVQILDGFETTRDNVEGALPALIQQAGFIKIENTSFVPTSLGTMRLIAAIKSE